MKTLFDKTRLAEIELKNRFIRSATYDGMADKQGHLTEKLFLVYENLAKGGVGMIITGLTSVTDLERPYPGQMGIYNDSFIEEYKKLTDMCHRHDTKIILQVVGQGSQTSKVRRDKVMWGPSPIKDLFYRNIPQAMTKHDINLVQKAFADAAERAKEAGFDGVQIHMAHGYLLSKFLTPFYNHRDDIYGGSIENRARMVLETYQSVREKVGTEFPLLVKINCQDFMERGMSFEDCKYVCTKLDEMGIDAIEISGGTPSSSPKEGTMRIFTTPDEESYFKPYAAEIAKLIKAPVILVGGNRQVNPLTDIINETPIEYIALGRPLICESHLINRWQSGETSPAKCISCNKCFRFGGTRCVIK